MFVSACVIVRNEAKNVRSWLENARIFADEIVVVDTGSEDETVDIVKEYGVQPIEFAWQEDFAGAKNRALEAAHGDWIVFCDADELFVKPEKVRGFLETLAGTGCDVVRVPLSNVDGDGKEIDRIPLVRIFRRLPSLRYFGCIHESLRCQNDTLAESRIVVADDNLLVRHTGYRSEILGEKCRRNLRILLHEQKEQGEDISRFSFIADCYMGIGDYKKAMEYAQRFINSGFVALGCEGKAYYEVLICLEKLGYSMDERLSVIDAGMERNPELPDFYGEKGMAYTELGRYLEGYVFLRKALEIYEQMTKDGSFAKASNFCSSVGRAFCMLGVCAKRLGREQEAAGYFCEALRREPYDEQILAEVADTLGGLSIQVIRKALPDWQDNAVRLGDIFLCHGFLHLQRYFYPDGMGYAALVAGGAARAADRLSVMLPLLFAVLLGHEEDMLSHRGRSPAEMLPEGMQRLLKVYFYGEFYPDLTVDKRLYERLLPDVLRYSAPEAKERYLKLGCSICSTARACSASRSFGKRSRGRKCRLLNKNAHVYIGGGQKSAISPDADDIRGIANEIGRLSLYITVSLLSSADGVLVRRAVALLPSAYIRLLGRKSFTRKLGGSWEENALCRFLLNKKQDK